MNRCVPVCPSCTEERRKQFQQSYMGYVKQLYSSKVKFALQAGIKTHENHKEHLWFEVQSIDFETNTFVGILLNQPVYGKEYQQGQTITVPLEEAENLTSYQ